VIVSHEHRYIFVRCRKTASTSLEIALSRLCGPADIITPIHSRDEVLRAELGGRGPQHHLNSDGSLRFYNHMPAAEIRVLVGERVWRSYLRWCVERNPWDKVASLYRQRHYNDEDPPSLRMFVESGASLRAVNFRLYTIGGILAVDRVARYERLAAELRDISASLNLPEQLEMPQAKSWQPPRRLPAIHFGPWERERVARQFAEEIALHGYASEASSSSRPDHGLDLGRARHRSR
jgi:hypothetical protein